MKSLLLCLLTVAVVCGCQKPDRQGEAFITLNSDEAVYLADVEIVCLGQKFRSRFSDYKDNYEKAYADRVEKVVETDATLKAEVGRIEKRISEVQASTNGIRDEVVVSLVERVQAQADTATATVEGMMEQTTAELASIPSELAGIRSELDTTHSELTGLLSELGGILSELDKTKPAFDEATAIEADLREKCRRIADSTITDLNKWLREDDIYRTEYWIWELDTELGEGIFETNHYRVGIKINYEGKTLYLSKLDDTPWSMSRNAVLPIIEPHYRHYSRLCKAVAALQPVKDRWDALGNDRIKLGAKALTLEEEQKHLIKRQEALQAREKLLNKQPQVLQQALEKLTALRVEEKELSLKQQIDSLRAQLKELTSVGLSVNVSQLDETQIDQAVQVELNKILSQIATLRAQEVRAIDKAITEAEAKLEEEYRSKFLELITACKIRSVRTGSKGDFVVPGKTAFVYCAHRRSNGERLVWLSKVDKRSPNVQLSLSTARQAGGPSKFDDSWMLSCDLDTVPNQQGEILRPALNKTFQSQLSDLMSAASQLNAATETGVSRFELQRLVSSAKGKFDVLEASWPEEFCPDAKKDFEQALEGWSIAAAGDLGSKYGNYEAQDLWQRLEAYETANPFEVRFNRAFEGVIALSSEFSDYNNNMPKLLIIASAYFKRAHESIQAELKD